MIRITKKLLLGLMVFIGIQTVHAQVTGTFTVNGDLDKYYPVTFIDNGWPNNVATEVEIGRSSVHRDTSVRGSVIAKFRFHTTNWGHGSNFINAEIRQDNLNNPAYNKFIAGWRDVTNTNGNARIIIWLRGGETSYSYKANYAVNPAVYDGVQNALPYQETNGPAHSYKTAIDAYVNEVGMSYNNTAYFNGSGINYYAGSLGIGTTTPGSYKLAVEGTIGARKVKVTQSNWADFVFEPEYPLPSLAELEAFIYTNKHLPDVPTEKEVASEGLDLGEMNKRLLQKIEELTLYLIGQNKQLKTQQEMIDVLKTEMAQLKANVQ